MTIQASTILVVDDAIDLRNAIIEYLNDHNYQAVGVGTCNAAVDTYRRLIPDAAIIDYALPDGTALDLIQRLKTIDPTVPLIVLTGHGSIDVAVQAVKLGAEQFLTKPVELAALTVVIDRAIENNRNRRRQLAGATRQIRDAVNPFVGTSGLIRTLREHAERVVASDYPVLLLGETGAGKGVLARWIHENSDRASESFVDLNCAGFARELLESELFGHEKGSFTGAVTAKAGLFEVAHRGMIFLDEIGDMDLQLQPKLLKVLEERRYRRVGDTKDRQVDVRLISATHQDLGVMVREKKFRADLYFRINTVSLHVPPLRNRREDIPELAQCLLGHIGIELGRPDLTLEPDAVEAIALYAWPGNVRELRNVLERGVLLCDGDHIQRRHLQFEPALSPIEPGDLSHLTLDELERLHIKNILSLECGSVPRAAVRLGIPRSTLYYKLKQFGNEQPEEPPSESVKPSQG